MKAFNRNDQKEMAISGYRVGTHIKKEGLIVKEYYIKTFVLRPFGKNPKIIKRLDAAQAWLEEVRAKTGNEDLFIDPIYVEAYKRTSRR